MKREPHERQVGDLLTTIAAILKYENTSGVLVTDDLTGATITFSMVNAATGVSKVDAQSATGGTGGSAVYQPVAADVDTPGIYHGFFVHTSGGSDDTYPVRRTDMRIEINSKTQSAKQAYDAAVAAL